MELGKTPIYCQHCEWRKATTTRQLCGACSRVPEIRCKYQAKRTKLSETGECIHAVLARERAAHPLWKPSPYPRSDPRFNVIVAARVAEGLPEFHEDDPDE